GQPRSSSHADRPAGRPDAGRLRSVVQERVDVDRSSRLGLPSARSPLRHVRCSVTFTSVRNVKVRRRGATTISSKHQITIPAAELRAAGLEAGERLVARADGPGRVVLEREEDVVAEFAGALRGVYADRELDSLRDEWD